MSKGFWKNTWGSIDWNKSETEILDKVKLLLSVGADVDAQSEYGWTLKDGWTALMFALANKNMKIVVALIKAGADPNKGYGDTALLMAARRNDIKLIEFMKNPDTVSYNIPRPQKTTNIENPPSEKTTDSDSEIKKFNAKITAQFALQVFFYISLILIVGKIAENFELHKNPLTNFILITFLLWWHYKVVKAEYYFIKKLKNYKKIPQHK